MFFTASKIFWTVCSPINLFFFALFAGTALLWTRWRRLGRYVLLAACAAAVVLTATPLATMALTALEDRFPAPQVPPERVDGIIVLAGMVRLDITDLRGHLTLNGSVDRLIAARDLAEAYSDARVVFTGGSGSLTRQDLSEARLVRPLLERWGLTEPRVMYEETSRNTCENAALSAALVHPKEDEVWLLVTSASHMPRAVGCFRAAGWDVVPYPVDYHTDGHISWQLRPNIARRLEDLQTAAHEWIGLLAYRLTGRIDTLFPGPED